MSESERPRRGRREIDWDKVARLLLRVFPGVILPGPELYDLVKDFQRSRTDLDVKVKRAGQALLDASQLVSELQTELGQRMQQVEKIRAEYQQYEQLAKIEEEKARALIKQLREAIGEGKGTERLIALGLNLLAGIIVFLLGVWASPWVMRLLSKAP